MITGVDKLKTKELSDLFDELKSTLLDIDNPSKFDPDLFVNNIIKKTYFNEQENLSSQIRDAILLNEILDFNKKDIAIFTEKTRKIAIEYSDNIKPIDDRVSAKLQELSDSENLKRILSERINITEFNIIALHEKREQLQNQFENIQPLSIIENVSESNDDTLALNNAIEQVESILPTDDELDELASLISNNKSILEKLPDLIEPESDSSLQIKMPPTKDHSNHNSDSKLAKLGMFHTHPSSFQNPILNSTSSLTPHTNNENVDHQQPNDQNKKKF